MQKVICFLLSIYSFQLLHLWKFFFKKFSWRYYVLVDCRSKIPSRKESNMDKRRATQPSKIEELWHRCVVFDLTNRSRVNLLDRMDKILDGVWDLLGVGSQEFPGGWVVWVHSEWFGCLDEGAGASDHGFTSGDDRFHSHAGLERERHQI